MIQLTSFRRLLFQVLLLTLVMPGCATLDLDATPAVQSYPGVRQVVLNNAGKGGRLRLMTVNIAHGRGEGFHQLLQDKPTAIANLDNIARVLRRSGAHVVALQEADAPSFWSGNFNHIDYLADKGEFRRSVHGLHADGLGVAYGTALISSLNLRDPQAITFDTDRSPVPKGFVVSTISWPGSAGIEVDVVSVHLDFASEANRQRQAGEMIATLRKRQRPMIVMGDFNSEWQENSTVRLVCRELGLSAYRPEAAGFETFPALGERLDWILVSPGITFRSYEVVQDAVSDHRGVLAELDLTLRHYALRVGRVN